jgi:hypothetical protein
MRSAHSLFSASGASRFSVVFEWNNEHTKTFSIFFLKMLVVHFMRFTDCAKIGIVRVFEPPQPLVDKDFMN